MDNMRKVEYLRAFADHTWDTITVDVPSVNEDPANGIDFGNLSDQDIDYELLEYAYMVLNENGENQTVILFAVFNSEVSD